MRNATIPADNIEALHGVDPAALARLKRGATRLVAALALALVFHSITRGLLRNWDEHWLTTLTATNYALIHAGRGVITTACGLLAVLGWRDIVRSERSAADSRVHPDPLLAKIIVVTLVVHAITLPLEPISDYVTAYTDWLDYDDSPYPLWAETLLWVHLLPTLAMLIAFCVRFVAGTILIGRLGERLGIAKHRRSSRNLLLFAAALPLVGAGAVILAMLDNEPLNSLGVLVLLGVALCTLVGFFWYLRLINAVRLRSKLALALARDGLLTSCAPAAQAAPGAPGTPTLP